MRLTHALELVLACGFSLAGCRQILGVESGTPLERPDGPALHEAGTLAQDAGRSFDAPPPYLTGSSCEDCIATNCSTQATSCDGDSDCAAWLADAREHAEAAASNRRSLELNAARTRTEAALDGGVATTPRTELTACARNRCTAACQLGRDFSCFGRYDWSSSYPTQTDLQFRIVDPFNQAKGFPAVDVRACLDAACDGSLGHAVSDESGLVDLTIRIAAFDLNTHYRYPEFDGFLLLGAGMATSDGGSTFYPLAVESVAPWISGDYGRWADIPIATMRPYFKLLGETYDAGAAYYEIQPSDCRREPAKGLTIEIWLLDSGGPRRCNDCAYFYPNDANLPDLAVTSFSTLGIVAFARGPARQSAVVLRDQASGRAVAARNTIVLPGHFHWVMLYPPSRTQLSQFPEGSR